MATACQSGNPARRGKHSLTLSVSREGTGLKKNQGNQSAGDRLPSAALCDSSMRALELARRLGLLPGDKTGTRAREGGGSEVWPIHWPPRPSLASA